MFSKAASFDLLLDLVRSSVIDFVIISKAASDDLSLIVIKIISYPTRLKILLVYIFLNLSSCYLSCFITAGIRLINWLAVS